jgi:hypothetical protein
VAVSRTLKRLVRVLELEEEQRRGALESALGQLHRIEGAIEAAGQRGRAGRQLVNLSAVRGEIEDRLAGIEEARFALLAQEYLAPRREEATAVAAEKREEYLSKRTERRQAETLVEAQEAQEALEAGRRSQAALDEWYLNRRQAKEAAEGIQKRKLAKFLSTKTKKA